MCEGLAAVREALLRVSAGFDPSRLSTVDAAALLAEASVIECTAASLMTQLSVRVAQSGSWRIDGEASPAHQLARQAGLSLGAAQAPLEAGRRLSGQPAIAATANSGQLSATQLVAVSDAAASDPGAEARLVALAGRRSVAELEEECRRTKTAAVRDGELQRVRIHARRSLRHYTDAEGVGHLRLMENPEIIAGLIASLAPVREGLFQAARRPGVRECGDALDADSLTTFVRDAAAHRCRQLPVTDPNPATASGRVKILVRVDLDTLLRGYPISDEVCEIVGYGPVAVSAVTDMIATGNPVPTAIVTRGQQVSGVAQLGRRPSAAQDSALQWLQPTCAVEGCHRSRYLERDHRLPWADTKFTLLEALDRLCEHHHRLKTHQDWALVDGAGKRQFVPPTDPRHPQPSRAPLPGVAPGGAPSLIRPPPLTTR